MTLIALVMLQLTDPFRVVLLIALFITMLRTREATGIWLPLLAGAVFVAGLLPMTMQSVLLAPMVKVVVAGFVANIVWLAVILAVWMVYRRLKQQG